MCYAKEVNVVKHIRSRLRLRPKMTTSFIPKSHVMSFRIAHAHVQISLRIARADYEYV